MVGAGCRFVVKTAEASKSAAFVGERVAGIQGGRTARNAYFLVEGSATRFE